MERKFIDLHVYSDISIGKNNLEKIVDYSKNLGLSSICLVDHIKDKNKDNLGKIKETIAQIDTDLEILIGAEICTDSPDIMQSQVKKLRNKADIIIVSGGISKINRAACEMPMVDILAHPERGRKDSGIDEVMAKLAHKNSVAIELNFKYVLHSYNKIRSHLISHMKTNVRLAKKYDATIIISSGAESALDLRAGRELASLGTLVGLELAESLDCISFIPQRIIEHVRKVKDPNYVMPGVETISKKEVDP